MRQTGLGIGCHPELEMSAGHLDRNRAGPTTFDQVRFAWVPIEMAAVLGDPAATTPRHYRGCRGRRRQQFGFPTPLPKYA